MLNFRNVEIKSNHQREKIFVEENVDVSEDRDAVRQNVDERRRKNIEEFVTKTEGRMLHDPSDFSI